MARFLVTFTLLILIVAITCGKSPSKPRSTRSSEKYINKSYKPNPKPKSYQKTLKSQTGKMSSSIKMPPTTKCPRQEDEPCNPCQKHRKTHECKSETNVAQYESKELDAEVAMECNCDKCCLTCRCTTDFPVININTYQQAPNAETNLETTSEEELNNEENEEEEKTVEETESEDHVIEMSCIEELTCEP